MRRAAASAAALLLVALAGGAMPRPSHAASPPPDAYLGVTGRPLLMPTNRTTNGRTWYFEVPKQPGEWAFRARGWVGGRAARRDSSGVAPTWRPCRLAAAASACFTALASALLPLPQWALW